MKLMSSILASVSLQLPWNDPPSLQWSCSVEKHYKTVALLTGWCLTMVLQLCLLNEYFTFIGLLIYWLLN